MASAPRVRALHGAGRVVRGAILLIGVLVVLVALLTLGARAGLPFVAGYKANIEVALADTLGRPVAIDALSLAWQGSGPVFDATGLSIGGAGAQRITLDKAVIDLHAFASLWRRAPVLNELTLVGAELRVVRERDGRYAVQGLGESGDAAAASPETVDSVRRPLRQLGWVFDAARVGLIDSRLIFDDRLTGRRLSFDAVSIVATNGAGVNRLRVQADLSDELGERVELDVDLEPLSSETTLDALNGRWHLRAGGLAFAPLLALLTEHGLLPVGSVPEGGDARLSTELWGKLEAGLPSRWHGRAEFTDLRAAPDRRAPAGLAQRLPDALSVPLSVQRDAAGGWQLTADGSEIVRGSQRLLIERLRARVDPQAAWRFEAQRAQPAPGRSGAPLAMLSGLSTLLPTSLAPAAFSWLDAAALRGRMRGWRLVMESQASSAGRATSPPVLSFDADVERFGMRPVGEIPGVDGLDVALQIADGRLRVGARPAQLADGSAARVRIVEPTRRAEPLLLSELDLDMTIEREPDDGWRVSGPVALVAGAFKADARVSVTIDEQPSPLLDVLGRFSLSDASQLADLLPDRLLGEATTTWFRQAMRAGSASEGQLLLLGRLADFPFENGEGVFQAGARVAALDLDWLHTWPAAQGLAGRIAFNGASVTASAETGRVGDMAIEAASLAIDDLRAPQLTLVASGNSQASQVLDFARQGPLASLLGAAFEGASGDGPVGLDLRVVAPLSDAAEQRRGPLRVDGTLFLSGNRLAFGQVDLELNSVTGGLSFDQDGARMHRVQAEWLGRPVRLDAETTGREAARALTLSLEGVAAADEIIAHFGLPLQRWFSGASNWRSELKVPFDETRMASEGVTLRTVSDLVGTTLLLPPPLDKRSGEAASFELNTAFVPDEPVVRWRVVQRSERLPALEALVDVAGEQLLSLAIGLGGEPAEATGRPGVRLDGVVDTLDADGWIEALATLIEDIDAAEPAAPAGPAGPDTPILPVSGDLQVNRLALRQAPLDAARIRLDTDARYLNVVLENPWLNGTLRYPRRWIELDGRSLPLTARLERVDGRVVDALLGESEPPDAERDPDEPIGGPDPRALPPIEAQIVSLGWGDLQLADVSLRTEPNPAGLDVTAIGFTQRHLQVFGEGRWELTDPERYDVDGDGEHRSEVALTVQSSDFESGLRDIGLTGLLGGTSGRATATLDWPGPLWSPDIATLDGDMELALTQGRVVPLEPGAGRLFGLFALQTLPRRLSLDFSDLVADGLAFSTLDGQATLEDGVLNTPLLQLTGPIGVIDVSGSTDLVQQTLDQRITVLPRVGAALPIIGLISGGATAGIGVLIAGGVLKVLGVEFDRIGLREYTLDGPWLDPRLMPLGATR